MLCVDEKGVVYKMVVVLINNSISCPRKYKIK